ncbi:pectin lyase fold/virulence factor [Roridomyces roridus]|uniref:Pectin lyase fold/virulence factor n=1 Tax=Roridomyces roridus TaxID=1738132 RepID=A0AAD7AZA4_9AGAR|nr:pectin lyase fold/virulence factor [Roridomyces roridus]
MGRVAQRRTGQAYSECMDPDAHPRLYSFAAPEAKHLARNALSVSARPCNGTRSLIPPLPFWSDDWYSHTSMDNSTQMASAQATGRRPSRSLTLYGVTIDGSAHSDEPNSLRAITCRCKYGRVWGNQAHHHRTIPVQTQDDCIAINSSNSITFTGNQCSGGHGRSIGSINTGDVVSNVTISNSVVTATVVSSVPMGFSSRRSRPRVSNVTYSSNNVSGVTSSGLLIPESPLDSRESGRLAVVWSSRPEYQDGPAGPLSGL